jgi:hypothetical protein
MKVALDLVVRVSRKDFGKTVMPYIAHGCFPATVSLSVLSVVLLDSFKKHAINNTNLPPNG